jgi:NADPH:quinone reductase-like Zn-dependent oxidoreductase
MHAAVVHTFGEPPRYESFPEPTAEEGEVMVEVAAAGLHPVVKALASGSHYASTDQLPLIPGVDGTGRLDGARVYFGGPRPPFGTMAERTVVPRSLCVPLPDDLDYEVAAAMLNPGLSAWLALRWRAQLTEGETVLVLGATGAAGQLAVQIAKQLGAGRVIAAGRDERVLDALPDLGADALIQVDQADQDLTDALAGEDGAFGIDVVIDYLWGRPTEALIVAITRRELTEVEPRVRLIQVGDSAGPTIALPAEVLRRSGLEVYGSGAGTISFERVIEALPEFMAHAASGKLRLGVERVPLAEVGRVWDRVQRGRRIVLVP